MKAMYFLLSLCSLVAPSLSAMDAEDENLADDPSLAWLYGKEKEEEKKPPRKKRNLTSSPVKTACDNCRERHVKCSVQKPCRQCLDKGLECVVEDTRQFHTYTLESNPFKPHKEKPRAQKTSAKIAVKSPDNADHPMIPTVVACPACHHQFTHPSWPPDTEQPDSFATDYNSARPLDYGEQPAYLPGQDTVGYMPLDPSLAFQVTTNINWISSSNTNAYSKSWSSQYQQTHCQNYYPSLEYFPNQ